MNFAIKFPDKAFSVKINPFTRAMFDDGLESYGGLDDDTHVPNGYIWVCVADGQQTDIHDSL